MSIELIAATVRLQRTACSYNVRYSIPELFQLIFGFTLLYINANIYFFFDVRNFSTFRLAITRMNLNDIYVKTVK